MVGEAATNKSGGGFSFEPVSAAINAAVGIGNAFFQAGEQKKMNEFIRSSTLLTNQQKNEIDRLYLNARTDTDRMAVLNQALAQIQMARVANSGKNQNTALIAVAVVAVVLMIAVYGIKRN